MLPVPRAPSPIPFCPAFFSIKTLILFRSSIRLNPVVFLSALLSGSIQSSSFPLFYPAQSSRFPFRSSIRLNPVVSLSTLLSGSIQSSPFPLFYPAQSSRLPFRSSIQPNPVVSLSAFLSDPIKSSSFPLLISGSIQSFSFSLFYPAQSSRFPFHSSIRLNPVVFLAALLSASIQSSSFFLNNNLKNRPTL